MATLDNFDSKLNDLQAEIQRVQTEKQQAAQRERDEKLALIVTYEAEANGYRNQAEKAASDADKRKLYKFADDSDKLAIELQKELGIYVESQPETDEVTQQQKAKLKTLRKINSLLIKAFCSLMAFFFSDYAAGKLDAGFFSYCLNALSRIAYFVSSVYGGCWLVCIILFSFVSHYAVNEIASDFKGLKPFHRLLILTAIGAALLHFFNGFVPYAD